MIRLESVDRYFARVSDYLVHARDRFEREIARFEGISTDSVRALLKTPFARLGVASRTEAATTALELGLLDA